MPCIENWQKKPLSIVQNIFENRSKDDWISEVAKYFESRLSNEENISVVPSLNDKPIHEIQPNCLVRFRCMVQDTFDNEFFLETYNITDKVKGETVMKTSCFQDLIGPGDYDIDMSSDKNKTGMRQILYCVSIPAETDWVKESWKSVFTSTKPNKEEPSTSGQSIKRSRDEDDDTMTVEEGNKDQGDRDFGSNKRVKPSANSGRSSSAAEPLNKNHPLPDENGPVCLVKVYDESADFKVNEIIEFYGVLSVDPELSSIYDAQTNEENGMCEMDVGDAEEKKAHHPPASIVPRLHALTMRRLNHDNPILPMEIPPEQRSQMQKDASTVRSCLLGLLEKALLGDSLAAEYLLLHLISRVYSRRDMLALGKFSLNISGIPPNSTYPRILSKFLQDLVTKLYYLPMSIDKLNEGKFIPTKNYSTNRLDSGILQLSTGTHLVLDETMLKPGTMDANGVKNVQALKNVLTFQKVDYNFQFHEASFDCDINVLILSEGKSMLPCDCQIELKPKDGFPGNIEEYFASFCSQCPMEFLNKSRSFISFIKLMDYELTQEMTKTIQDDFVSARRQDPNGVTADDLHAWLVLARLLSISVGQQNLSHQRWERVKALEVQRKERLTGSTCTSQFNGS
uniref:mini-chromosome maintenance complex-binding protein-like n=1 Tax=Styela clava TaxID=7725 RepID=UPI0019398623|nr:mini-chromosome maintenance complex-binding protein-like [Styela clava]